MAHARRVIMLDWARPCRPLAGERPDEFAARLLNCRKPQGLPGGFGSELFAVQRWAAAFLRDRLSGPPGDECHPIDEDRDRRAVAGSGPTQFVHELYHYKVADGRAPDPDDELDDAKSIGTYSSVEKARAAMRLRKGDEGFRDWPGGFRIYSYPMDDTAWIGGYSPQPPW